MNNNNPRNNQSLLTKYNLGWEGFASIFHQIYRCKVFHFQENLAKPTSFSAAAAVPLHQAIYFVWLKHE